ncbi:MAG: threonine synthase [Alphaproteobacteria bacterium]|nr:threonine synthase [Alphaproteobacteria bacterium]
MRYISTRGQAAPVTFRQAVVSGLAPDGGLFMPAAWPQFPEAKLRAMADMPFSDIVATSLASFFDPDDDVPDGQALAAAMRKAYESFDADETVILRQLDESHYVLELFHGPTLAFKDVAMQALAQLYPWAQDGLTDAGSSRRKTILAATSGDTGGAAIAAFANTVDADIIVFHPKGRISEVQRRIMTTTPGSNISNIAIDDSFDVCQRLVKELFGDPALNEKLDLGGVNSINWVRLAIQASYYFATYARLGKASTFVVPTGNFGDIFAGYAAWRMGLPVLKLVAAVNENDIVHRAISSGDYSSGAVRATSAPSMDIQIASNFERLLFEAMGRDATRLRKVMTDFAASGAISVPADVLTAIQKLFSSGSATGSMTDKMIEQTWRRHDYLIDPHTAIGMVVAEQQRSKGVTGPIVTLSTAHPAKFPEAVARAAGVEPALPDRYADLFDREESLAVLPADVRAISSYILNCQAVRG